MQAHLAVFLGRFYSKTLYRDLRLIWPQFSPPLQNIQCIGIHSAGVISVWSLLIVIQMSGYFFELYRPNDIGIPLVSLLQSSTVVQKPTISVCSDNMFKGVCMFLINIVFLWNSVNLPKLQSKCIYLQYHTVYCMYTIQCFSSRPIIRVNV